MAPGYQYGQRTPGKDRERGKMKIKFFYNPETFGWVTDSRLLHWLAMTVVSVGGVTIVVSFFYGMTYGMAKLGAYLKAVAQ